MSAAMLTQRKPVLPLARCGSFGEWSYGSRCVYVVHAAKPDGARYCVQRPPVRPQSGRACMLANLQSTALHVAVHVL